MVDVFTDRVLRPLTTNEVFVVTLATLHSQPVISRVPLVLVAFAKVPSQYKVFSDVVDARSDETHADVVPWHATEVGLTQLVVLPVINTLEIHNTVIVEVLTWPGFILRTCWVNICQRMLLGIPSTEASVETTNKGKIVVNDDELFVMCPVKCHVSGVLKNVVVGMSHNMNVTMAWAALWTKRTEGMLGVKGVASDGCLDLLVHYNVNLNSALGSSLEDLIKTPFLVVVRWSAQKEFRREPPIGHVDGLFGSLESNTDGPEVISSVDIPLDSVSVSFRREAVEAVASRNAAPLLVGDLLVFFIVTVVGVDEVLELADPVFQVNRFDLEIVQACILHLVSHLVHRTRVGFWPSSRAFSSLFLLFLRQVMRVSCESENHCVGVSGM